MPEAANVQLTIPALADYVHLARAVAAAVGSSAALTIDEIDDLRIAVDELCAAFDQAGSEGASLELTFGRTGIEVSVSGVLAASNGRVSDLPALTEWSRQILGAVVDHYEVGFFDGHPGFRLAKAGALGLRREAR